MPPDSDLFFSSSSSSSACLAWAAGYLCLNKPFKWMNEWPREAKCTVMVWIRKKKMLARTRIFHSLNKDYFFNYCNWKRQPAAPRSLRIDGNKISLIQDAMRAFHCLPFLLVYKVHRPSVVRIVCIPFSNAVACSARCARHATCTKWPFFSFCLFRYDRLCVVHICLFSFIFFTQLFVSKALCRPIGAGESSA